MQRVHVLPRDILRQRPKGLLPPDRANGPVERILDPLAMPPYQSSGRSCGAKDEVAVAGAHRIAIDASGCDLLATSALNRLVDTQDQRASGREGGHEQVQEHAASASARPNGPIENAVIRLEIGQVSQTSRAQARADHATARSQQGPNDEVRHMASGPARELRRELVQ
jgi:hypothetical protein